jgi:Ricin-type beta-trefoil lectin domain-like
MPRLAGIGLAVLLAAGGTAAYLLLPTTAHAGRHAAARPPARVQTKLAVTIATARMALRPGARTVPEILVGTSAGLAFTAVAPGSAALGIPAWTADQMTGGGYVFVDVALGECLAEPVAGSTAATLRQCDLGAGQRWQRRFGSAAAAGHLYWQLRNAADGLCLTVGAAVSGSAKGPFAALVERCGEPQPSRQLVTFLSG